MNYPNGIKKAQQINDKKNIIYKNRGMNLENLINDTNEYYVSINKAFIYKKPTPIKLVKVDYKSKKITEGYFEKPSTTDYNGIYKGKYIDFEAKETNNINSFPLINIQTHQLKHMQNIYKAGGICFLIVRFTKLNKNYLLMASDLFQYLDNENKKTIPLTYFEQKAYLIKEKYIPSIDYLSILDEFGGIYEK